MKKAEVNNVSPAACIGRGSVGRSQAVGGGLVPSEDHSPDFGITTITGASHCVNVLNNNVEVNGLVNGSVISNNNNKIDRNNTRKKIIEGKDREQGSIGYVSERVRALSVSNRNKTHTTHRFGPADLRASYNERQRSGPTSLQPLSRVTGLRTGQDVGGGFVFMRGTGGLYRSNSSLDLDHDVEEQPPASPLRREYGSHGSINVASAPSESLYSILREFKPSESIKCASSSTDNVAGSLGNEADATSPKARSKFQKLWDKDKSSIFKKLRSSKSTESKGDSKCDINSETSVSSSITKSCKSSEGNGDSDSRSEELLNIVPTRRSAFAHYDCRSLATQFILGHVRSLLTERANTTTGASAAAMAGSLPSGLHHDSTEDLQHDEHDPGDGRSNPLINSCPFFRNELGGEGERIVSLSRDWGCGTKPNSPSLAPVFHRPVAAATIGLLEPAVGQSHWRMTLCPYVRSPFTIEAVDQGATYYRTYFCLQDHQNWFGIDDMLGPVAISIRREKLEDASDSAHSLPTYQYRIIVRTSELFSCQGSVLEESLGRLSGEKGRSPGVREALEYVCPQLSLGCLRLGQPGTQTEEALIRLDDLGVHNKFKVGVLYCRAGQTTEEEMYNNESAGPAFSEFLEVVGQRVRLKDFDKYRGGLDKKTDSTGLYSVYNQYRDAEIMFHVSTLLPFTPNNRKQLLRKRHIGNDIVTIIFQEPGAPPFSPKHIRSHFQHVFIVVQAINPCTENTQYRVTVSRFRDVPLFGPMMPEGATFPKSKVFTDFLLAKAINGEIAALRSEKFAAMATRTRHEYLKDLALNHSSSTTLDTSTKFSLMGFSRGGKKEKKGVKYIPDATVRGALSWPLTVHDAALQYSVDCVIGISIDSMVVVEESSATVIFAAPCKSVIGWTIKPLQGLRIFYHQGECLLVNLRPGTPEADCEEILSEIVSRLTAVTQGAETQELELQRNQTGLLGFNVQQDGVITEVEPYGLASQSGLRQGARLVEICTVTLATLSQEQMVDLLKTSMTVTVTIVPSHPDGAPRRGCNVPTCGFLLGGSEGDYENLTTPEQLSRKKSRHNHRYDRSLSPPRSSNSSGYGTGNSSRSFTVDQRTSHDFADPSKSHPNDYQAQPQEFQSPSHQNNTGEYEHTADYERTPDYMGTLSSTSSSHSSDRWTEPLDEQAESPPPPLPARTTQLSGCGDYDNAPLRQPDSQRGRQAADKAGGVPPNNTNTQAQLSEYIAWRTERLNGNVRSSSLPGQSTRLLSQDDTTSMEHLHPTRSEDELSGGSGSPHTKRQVKGGNTTPSSTSSRNQSPRTVATEARLRQAATPRKNSQRNSANLVSSSLQEELFRLINPDYISDTESLASQENTERPRAYSLGISAGIAPISQGSQSNNSSLDRSSVKSSGVKANRERPNLSQVLIVNPPKPSLIQAQGSGISYRTFPVASSLQHSSVISVSTQEQISPDNNQNVPLQTEVAEVVVLTARPATVISNSSTSSPATTSDQRVDQTPVSCPDLNIGGQMHPPNKAKSVSVRESSKNHQWLDPTGENKAAVEGAGQDQSGGLDVDQEWMSLVNTATQAIQKSGEIMGSQTHTSQPPTHSWSSHQSTSRMGENVIASADASILQDRVAQLECRLVAEQQRSEQLENEVTQLRTENRKLQEDSRAAAQQLHQFTEWFFNTIDKT
nr:signal-induced proliferation-associated 1-like protein 1 isoform X1 [Procambarus clarkii]XP_045598358.1 signal-induced proliferation-associated 1-like protein 1 isoform X1 [Procambarus clarkii]XP_045598359.1 signal-induced proliferation-associated 1-like protein 1 isoform X1 [Procambarus clarkii]